ncbi:DUF1731 domain-containing protein [Nocardia abscessus]|uniref:DUF1731 domain-containing protein n=1 Tax=Nocardia TaxID=1817 RepID=UPI0018957928|nr:MULTISPECIES: DUF1731 domain-containing protein [Nocardia]MBF6216997.1 DUF1731 domain-containing protein [Nocardia abscessus]MDE1673626.1 DUF1731 domain-containing protein [Nocardia gipuzkoensis]
MTRRTTTYTQFIALPAERIWQVLADPARWPEWNPDITAVRLSGPITVGSRGTYVPSGRTHRVLHPRTALPFIVAAARTGQEFRIEQPEPLGRMRLSWTLTPRDGGTELTQRLTFLGASSGVARPLAAFLESEVRVRFARLARVAGLAPGPDALTVVIPGGSGGLGRHVAADLTCRGHRAIILTRHRDPELPFEQVEWDGRTVDEWVAALRNPGRTAIVNLAGKLVDCRPTPQNIAELRDSRVDSTRTLVAAAATLDAPIDYWVQASTTAIWSDAGETRCTESTPLPIGLPQMTGVAEPWERAFDPARAVHWTVLRTSIVLDPRAPALRRLGQLTKAGLGGRVGSGEQWFSWIHIEDWLAIVRAALGLDPAVELPDGVLVAATDAPVRNRELMRVLRKHLHRPPAPPTPKRLLSLGAVLLRSDPALGLTGRHATSEVLKNAGFTFRYPTLDEALANLLPH